MTTIDFKSVIKDIELSSGDSLGKFGELFSVNRYTLESDESYRKRVLYVYIVNLNFLINGGESGIY